MTKIKWILLIGFLAISLFFITLKFQKKETGIEVNVPKQFSDVAIEGSIIFENKCSRCHGIYGDGTQKGPPLIHIYYEPNHHSDRSFFLAVKNGVRPHHWRFGSMPPIKGVSREDVKKIIPYIREIQKENGIF